MRIQRGRELGYLLALTVAISVLQYVFSFCRRLLFNIFPFPLKPLVILLGKPYNSTRTRQQLMKLCVCEIGTIRSYRNDWNDRNDRQGLTAESRKDRKAGTTGKAGSFGTINASCVNRGTSSKITYSGELAAPIMRFRRFFNHRALTLIIEARWFGAINGRYGRRVTRDKKKDWSGSPRILYCSRTGLVLRCDNENG